MKKIILGIIIAVVIIGGPVLWFSHKSKDSSINLSTTQTVTSSDAPILSITAFNQTANSSATSIGAHPGDTVVFTLNAENPTNQTVSGYVVQINIADLVQTATLIDAGGAGYNSATSSLVWTPLDIAPNGSIEQKFTVRVNQPSLSQNLSTLKVTFNNQIEIGITKPQVAGAETSKLTSNSYKAPVTGINENLTFALAVIITLGVWVIKRRKAVKI